MKRLAIIDGKSVFYRGYYAMPGLSTRDGTPTGGVYGFAAMSLELIKKLEPDYVCVAWDKPKTNIRKRREIYPEYKAGRKAAPPDFYAQIPILHELLEALSWPLYELDDYEADDIMGTLARQAEAEGLETCLISSDLDMLQCLAPNTHMYALKKGFSQIEMYRPEDFERKYGIDVEQFLDLKSLKGDSSDNIPGVPGVGEKGAIKLLQQYRTLDGIYEHVDDIKGALQKKLIEGKESAYMSREIAQLFCDAPLKLDLPAMDIRDLDTARLKEMLQQLEFTSLLRNLPEHMQVVEMEHTDEEAMQRAEFDETAQTSLLMAEQVLMLHHDDKLYVAADREQYYEVKPPQIAAVIKNVSIVTHDGDALCHFLLSHDIELPKTLYDIRQAAFLLDPLRRSHELATVTHYDGDDIGVHLAVLWTEYDREVAELAKLPQLKKVAYDIDFPLIPILARMEHRGIILDTTQLEAMNTELSSEIASITREMYDMVGYEFNIASPAQLAEVLYTKLQLPTIGIKKGKTGYSTGQKELDKLRGQHPIIEQIERYRELTKLQNTYVEALPKLVDDQSRLHTTFNQDVAATGRLSSTDPNLQNIPIRTEQGRKIREAFVPSPGNVFVSADYSQFELRLVAVLAGDDDMINDFNAGTDIHAKTASDVYKIPLDNVTKAQRRAAKVINFGVLYGMSPHGLAAAAGMSFIDAKKFIDEYFRIRHKVRTYIDATIKRAHDDGYVETLYGRRRPTPDVKSSNFIVRQAAERAAANMPIQGTEADLMKLAMITVEQKLAGSSLASERSGVQNGEKNAVLPAESRAPRSDSDPLGVQVLQIHDSILVECAQDEAENVSEILKSTMESIAPDLPVKLQVDVSVGENWGEV